MLKIDRVTAHVTNVNSRPEKHGDSSVFATDLTMALAVPKDVFAKLLPTDKPFFDQFYAGDDAILQAVCPIVYHRTIKNVAATIGFDEDELRFEACKIKKDMALKPLSGGSIEVKMTLQVYPGSEEISGTLDFLSQRWVDLQVSTPQTDVEDATDGGSDEDPE